MHTMSTPSLRGIARAISVPARRGDLSASIGGVTVTVWSGARTGNRRPQRAQVWSRSASPGAVLAVAKWVRDVTGLPVAFEAGNMFAHLGLVDRGPLSIPTAATIAARRRKLP